MSVAGRASIVGAAATHVGKVRDHNEDAHFFDPELGIFLVCDGMGGHAAGEVASALAIREICQAWRSDRLRTVSEEWLERGTPEARKQLIEVVRAGVIAAHRAIVAEAERDDMKIVAGLVTHFHPDHLGGDLPGNARRGGRDRRCAQPGGILRRGPVLRRLCPNH